MQWFSGQKLLGLQAGGTPCLSHDDDRCGVATDVCKLMPSYMLILSGQDSRTVEGHMLQPPNTDKTQGESKTYNKPYGSQKRSVLLNSQAQTLKSPVPEALCRVTGLFGCRRA